MTVPEKNIMTQIQIVRERISKVYRYQEELVTNTVLSQSSQEDLMHEKNLVEYSKIINLIIYLTVDDSDDKDKIR